MSDAKPYRSVQEYREHIEECGGGHDEARVCATIEALEKVEAERDEWERVAHANLHVADRAAEGANIAADERDVALAQVKELEATVEAQKRGDAHDTIREMLAPLGIGPHDDVVQSVRELVAWSEKLVKKLESRRFPVLGAGYSVPWALVAPFEEQAKRNHGGQSLERLADRGGLSPNELWCVMHSLPWQRRQTRAQQEAVLVWARNLAVGVNLPADTVRQVREALEGTEEKLRSAAHVADAYVAADRTAGGTNWLALRGRLRESAVKARAALELLKEDK